VEEDRIPEYDFIKSVLLEDDRVFQLHYDELNLKGFSLEGLIEDVIEWLEEGELEYTKQNIINALEEVWYY